MDESAGDSKASLAQISATLIHERFFDEVSALLNLLTLLDRAGRLEDAYNLVDHLDRFAGVLPEGEVKTHIAAAIATTRAMALAKQGQLDEALDHFDRSIMTTRLDEKLNPLTYASHTEKGLYLKEAGRWAESLSSFQTAEELDRNFNVEPNVERKYSLQISIVATLIELGQPQAVVTQIERALSWIPERACTELGGLLLQLGNYRLFLERHDDAISAYRHGIAICDDCGDTKFRSRLLRGEAIANYEKGVARGDPDALKASARLGAQALNALVDAGEISAAIDHVRWLARTLQAQNKPREALQACLRGADLAAHLGLDSEAFTLTAQAGFISSAHLRDHATGALLYQRALQWQPGSTAEHQRVVAALATIFYAAGELAVAAGYLEQSCRLLSESGAVQEAARERDVLRRVKAEIAAPGRAVYPEQESGRGDDGED